MIVSTKPVNKSDSQNSLRSSRSQDSLTKADPILQAVAKALEGLYEKATLANLASVKGLADALAQHQSNSTKKYANEIAVIAQDLYRKTFATVIEEPFTRRLEESTTVAKNVKERAEKGAEKAEEVRRVVRQSVQLVSAIASGLNGLQTSEEESGLMGFTETAEAQMDDLRSKLTPNPSKDLSLEKLINTYDIAPPVRASLVGRVQKLQTLQFETMTQVSLANRTRDVIVQGKFVEELNRKAVNELETFDQLFNAASDYLNSPEYFDYGAARQAFQEAEAHIVLLEATSKELSIQTKNLANMLFVFGAVEPSLATLLDNLSDQKSKLEGLGQQIGRAIKLTDQFKGGDLDALSADDFVDVPTSVYASLKAFIQAQLRIRKDATATPEAREKAIEFREKLSRFVNTLANKIAKNELNVPGLQKSFCEKFGEFIAWILSLLSFGQKARIPAPASDTENSDVESLYAYYQIVPSTDADLSDTEE